MRYKVFLDTNILLSGIFLSGQNTDRRFIKPAVAFHTKKMFLFLPLYFR